MEGGRESGGSRGWWRKWRVVGEVEEMKCVRRTGGWWARRVVVEERCGGWWRRWKRKKVVGGMVELLGLLANGTEVMGEVEEAAMMKVLLEHSGLVELQEWVEVEEVV